MPSAAQQTIDGVRAAFEAFQFSLGITLVWASLTVLDKLIVEAGPWMLAKTEVSQPRAKDLLDGILYTTAESLRIAAVLLYPVLPESTQKIWRQLGMTEPLESVRLDTLAWGQLPPGQKIGEIAPVFPRIDAVPAIEKMKELEVRVTEEQNVMMGKASAAAPPASDRISIDDFAKVDMRVGQVLSAEPVKGADKLLRMLVDIGEPQPRTIVAGIAEAYPPAQLIGRKVVIVANLQPRKLRGIESNGMIVAGSIEGGKPVLAGFLEDVPIGARLK